MVSIGLPTSMNYIKFIVNYNAAAIKEAVIYNVYNVFFVWLRTVLELFNNCGVFSKLVFTD